MDQTQDEQHLQLLSIFHYLVGAIAGLIACFPLIHFVVGIGLLVSGLFGGQDEFPMIFIGLLFAVVAGSMIVVGWIVAICILLTGWFLSARKNYLFCLVVAGVECAFAPFGTVLGVFTIITLTRPSVKQIFADKAK